MIDALKGPPQSNNVATEDFRHRKNVMGQSCRLCRLRVCIGGYDCLVMTLHYV